MPIKIPDYLPAMEILNSENVFVMAESRAYHQDIRPLKIAILNLMPNKDVTETQILRLLSNSPLQVEITLLHMESHIAKNTAQEYLDTFYTNFSAVKRRKFDGMIITGAPVEQLEFEEVTYWTELREVMEWTRTHVTSTLHICWGAQAGLYYHYGVPKYPLSEKMFGVFPHKIYKINPNALKLLRGFDDEFYAPHSRHSEVRREDVGRVPELKVWAESDEAGIYLVASDDGRQIFVTGHSEYDLNTLKAEYERDLAKGLNIKIPRNYFPQDDPGQNPVQKWRSHANLLFSNWLNYFVYQETPYELDD